MPPDTSNVLHAGGPELPSRGTIAFAANPQLSILIKFNKLKDSNSMNNLVLYIAIKLLFVGNIWACEVL